MNFLDFYTQEHMEKTAAKAKTEPAIRQGLTSKLVVTLSTSDSASKPFVEKLDKVLQSMSGFERVEIVALDAMKDSATIKKLGMPIPGLLLLRRGKDIDSMSGANSTEGAIAKFLNSNRKFW